VAKSILCWSRDMSCASPMRCCGFCGVASSRSLSSWLRAPGEGLTPAPLGPDRAPPSTSADLHFNRSNFLLLPTASSQRKSIRSATSDAICTNCSGLFRRALNPSTKPAKKQKSSKLSMDTEAYISARVSSSCARRQQSMHDAQQQQAADNHSRSAPGVRAHCVHICGLHLDTQRVTQSAAYT
jgi:hypothetical protein